MGSAEAPSSKSSRLLHASDTCTPPAPELPWISSATLIIELNGRIGPEDPINLSRIERQLATASRLEHVHLDVDCVGGDARESERIYQTLRALPCPISAFVKNRCFSAGIELLMAAGLRFADVGAKFLIHGARRERASLPEEITVSVLAPVLQGLVDIDERIARVIHYRAGAPLAWIKSQQGTEDCYLDLAEAFANGLVHDCGSYTLNSAWPKIAPQIARQVFLPPRMLTANYFEACHTLARIEAHHGGIPARRATLELNIG